MSNSIPLNPVTPESLRWKPVVRGYAEGTEILTEYGFVSLEQLHNDNYLGEPIPFKGNNYSNLATMKELEWGQWATNEKFPKVATLDLDTGQVVFVRPTRFVYFNYDHKLVLFKAKGVNIITSLFTDLWLKPKYARAFKFVLANDAVKNNSNKTFYYQMLDKFNKDLYGDFKPKVKEEPEPGTEIHRSNLTCQLDRPINLKPYKHIKRKNIWKLFKIKTVKDGITYLADRQQTHIPIYNVEVAPHHNIIIRRERANDNPRTRWVGNPVVVGDALDKSLLRISKVSQSSTVAKGAAHYSELRPDWKTLNTQKDSFEKD